MAWQDDGQGICRARTAHRTRGIGIADCGSHLLVTARGPVVNRCQLLLHGLTKAVCE